MRIWLCRGLFLQGYSLHAYTIALSKGKENFIRKCGFIEALCINKFIQEEKIIIKHQI